ncbi:multiheme c-type cytochrome [Ferrimonas marina]|uniref:Decaheme c-type cytochrome, OmcA/MtrC family n=1 Tax=Ferrimonas marina TaxID=299255 RepID=A0A1M5X4D8_9GAMM|nr:hypothetical protein [Ferrimonas marina]SHH94671.1 decaheme c-type cytochrome, OmcA/MtrC family [Ferrimonas marina]
MMMNKKTYLAMSVAAAVALAGCSDGKDGQDGADGPEGPQGPGYVPPMVDSAEVTNLEVLHYAIEEGQVTLEFEITDADGYLVEGLDRAEVKFAAQTDRGIVLNRDGEIGGYGTYTLGGDSNAEGASLEMDEDGLYTFVYPMAAVAADDAGILWLRVGGGEAAIARTQPLIVTKPEMVHTSSTETCYSCHVDYATSSLKHPSYTAVDMNGDVDFVAGCLVCHNNVSSADEQGGYAANTLQKIGHVNHQKFEKDFAPTNCYACHEEAPINVSFGGPGCVDCHTSSLSEQPMPMNADMRELHANAADKATGITIAKNQQLRAEYTSSVTAPVMTEEGYCSTLTLFKGEEKQDLEALKEAGTVSYAGAYLHGYKNSSILGRSTNSYNSSYVDGAYKMCFTNMVEFPDATYMASTRITFNEGVDAGYTGVTLHAHSDNADGTKWDRRLSVHDTSCTTCHTSESNYHKNGAYADGGLGCVACHNNGQNRNSRWTLPVDAFVTAAFAEKAGFYALTDSTTGEQTGWTAGNGPGYGPMVHGSHWGKANVRGSVMETDRNGNEYEVYVQNSAAQLNAENCVACHADGVDLFAIPNQYMRARSFHNGDTDMLASPITANCFACHYDDAALNHMVQNGGEIDASIAELEAMGINWYDAVPSESCAVCHAEGKTFGIDMYHNF